MNMKVIHFIFKWSSEELYVFIIHFSTFPIEKKIRDEHVSMDTLKWLFP